MDHAKNIPSTEEEALRETKRVTEALTANNYPANFIYSDRQLNRQQEVNDTDQRGMVILPYAKGFSERIAKVGKFQTYLKNQRQDRERGFQRNRAQDQM